MTALRISVAGRDYEIACDDGQENHLKSLARALDGRIRSLGEHLGKAGEAQLLLLAALTLMDESQDQAQEIDHLKRDIRHSSQSFEQNKQIELESAVAATIHDIASRIEAIASELERV